MLQQPGSQKIGACQTSQFSIIGASNWWAKLK